MSFDRLAPHYRWLEAVLAGSKLQRCRTAWLDTVTHCRRALLVGEGNGRFLAACAERLPDTHFTVVDASREMLRRAQDGWGRVGGGESQADFIRAALPGIKLADGGFDLLVTHFFLDCFPREELPAVVGEIGSLAAPSASWLLADFAVPAKGLARLRAKAILGLAYTFFRWSTELSARHVVPPAPWLKQAGFVLAGRVECEWGLLYSERWTRTMGQAN